MKLGIAGLALTTMALAAWTTWALGAHLHVAPLNVCPPKEAGKSVPAPCVEPIRLEHVSSPPARVTPAPKLHPEPGHYGEQA